MRSTVFPVAFAALLLGASVSGAGAGDAPRDTSVEAYVDGMARTMSQWADRVGDWTARQVDAAGDTTAKAGEKTGETLDNAWSAVERDWGKVQDAGADGYAAARREFEASLEALDRVWQNRSE